MQDEDYPADHVQVGDDITLPARVFSSWSILRKQIPHVFYPVNIFHSLRWARKS